MTKLFTNLSKNVLSLVVGPRMDREWTGIRPMRFIAILAMMLCFSVWNVWGTNVTFKDAVYEFNSSTTPSGWSVSSSNEHASNYMKFSPNDYVEMTAASIFPSGHALYSSNIKVEVSCGTFNTWTNTKSVKCTVALLDKDGNVLSSSYSTFSSLTNKDDYQTAINVSKPSKPTDIVKLRITFSNFVTPNAGAYLRFRYVKLTFQTAPSTAKTVSFDTGTGNSTVSSRTEASVGAGITLPSTSDLSPAATGWSLYGWATASYSESTSAPSATLVGLQGAHYEPESDITLYAVYVKSNGGTGAPVEEVIWKESFDYYSNSHGDKPTSTNSNTYAYGGASLTYVFADGTGDKKGTTYIATDTKDPTRVPELFLGAHSASGSTAGTFTASGIPSGSATTMTLRYRTNNSNSVNISSSTDDFSVGSATQTNMSGYYACSCTVTCGSASTFDLTFKAGASGKNVRVDNIVLVVATSSNADYTFNSNPSACTNTITIGEPSITGSGTVTFASGGSSKSAGDAIETCDDGAEITATVTPASGYYCSGLTFSGGSVSVSPTPGEENYPAYSSTQDYTLSFGEDANATLSTSATFTAKTATAWSWTYNSGAIPNPLEMYVNEYHQLDVTYTPADLLSTQKNYTVTKESSVAEVSKQVGYYKMRGAAGVTEVTNTTVTLTLGDLSQTVNVKVKPLPTIHCVDLIHGESFSDVAATVATGVVTLTKTMPTHDDLDEPGSGNDCEKEHLHLIGWIRSDYSKVDAYMNGTGNKPTISEITSAGTGYYYTAGSSITLTDTMHGKTFYAVWAKEE